MIRNHSGKTTSRGIVINGKTFFSLSYSTKSAFRAAAKRFANNNKLDPLAMYYDGNLINGRWHFNPLLLTK